VYGIFIVTLPVEYFHCPERSQSIFVVVVSSLEQEAKTKRADAASKRYLIFYLKITLKAKQYLDVAKGIVKFI
jgi:hypothetical protein